MMATTTKAQRRLGAAAVEVAVVLLFLAPLLVGTWEVGRLVQVQQLLFNAAREGGRQAASSNLSASAVQGIVCNYLTLNGIPCSTSNVTVTNLSDSARSDPTTANQLDAFQVTVTIPFNSVRWVILKQITSTTNLTASTTWYSMNDLPLNINTAIPLN